MSEQTEVGEEITEEELEREQELRSKFVKIKDGDEKTLRFDSEARKVIEEDRFNPGGEKRMRIFFDVTDTDTQMKKIFTTSIPNALKIKKLLKQGNKMLKITRFGEGRNTKYAFKPAT